MTDANPSAGDYCAMVGHALTTWGMVESAHASLFETTVSHLSSCPPLREAYWAIVSFEGKQKFVDAAMREVFKHHPMFLARWNTINNRLISKNQKRNKLAHGTVLEHTRGDGTSTVMFIPYFDKYIKNHLKDGEFVGGLSWFDLKSMQESFGALRIELVDLTTDYFHEQIFPAWPKLPDGSKEGQIYRPPKPPTSKEPQPPSQSHLP